jgi:hypothetical protein
MKTKMFKGLMVLTAMAALLCAFAPVKASAQQYGLTSLSATNKQGVAVTNTYEATGNVIGVAKHDQVAILIGAELMASGTSTSLWEFAYSIDGTTNFANFGSGGGLIPIVLTHTDTTPDYFVTNINVGAIGYLGLRRIGNNGTQILTNITVKYAVKPKRNG